MSTKQVVLLIGVTTALALSLAWVVERAQVRAFMFELDQWWTEREDRGHAGNPPTD